jgi:hypothetical protein
MEPDIVLKFFLSVETALIVFCGFVHYLTLLSIA